MKTIYDAWQHFRPRHRATLLTMGVTLTCLPVAWVALAGGESAGVAPAAVAAPAPAPAKPNITFDSAGPDTRIRASWSLYRLEIPQVSREAFGEFVKRNLPGEPTGEMSELSQRLVYADSKDRSVFFMQDQLTGNLMFQGSMIPYFGNTRPILPGPDDARKLALEYLRTQELFPVKETQLKMVHSGGLRYNQVREGKPGPILNKLRIIHFGRLLGGVRVLGPGSKITVSVGDGGAVVGLQRKWREVGASSVLASTELKSPEGAQREFGEFLQSELGPNVQARVGPPQIFYHDGDGQYIQPAYYFKVTIPSVDGLVSYLSAVPAMKQPPERVGPGQIPSGAIRNLVTVGPDTIPPPGPDARQD